MKNTDRKIYDWLDKSSYEHYFFPGEYFPNEANKVYGENSWRFQQDNAPSHKSYRAIEWLKENTPWLIKHPPQSPDLNPMELIWVMIKKEIEIKQPKTQQLLKDVENMMGHLKFSISIHFHKKYNTYANRAYFN